MKTFNVIIWDINKGEFIPYNIIPYLTKVYKESKDKPKTLEEFINFVDKEAKYQFWSRCEYEIILEDWPCQTVKRKIDIYFQIKMNINLISKLLMDEVLYN